MTSIPNTRVISLTHARYAAHTAVKSKGKPTLEQVLKASHQLNYRHVLLMQSKLRSREPYDRRIATGNRTNGVDECVSAACEDSPVRADVEAEQWDVSPKVITPMICSPSAAKGSHTADSHTRRTTSSLSRSPISERPLSQRAKARGKMFAPLSRQLIPSNATRRRVSAVHFTLEDFAHSRNSSHLEPYS